LFKRGTPSFKGEFFLKTQGFRNKFKLIRRIATLFQGHRSALILAIWSVLGRTLLMVALPLIFREIIDRGILSKEVSLLLVLAGAYFIMTLLQGILEYFQSLLVGYMGISIVNDLKQKAPQASSLLVDSLF
jgi:ABC-type bacteriocin/lantibiotic exporter with double-glycine peptidase domain